MKTTVKVTANPANGQVFTRNESLGKDGKVYGYIRVESSKRIENGGFLVTKTVSALVPMSEENFIKDPLQDGQELGGKIIIIESLEQKPGYQPKLAGANGTPCTLDGRQIYRATKWTMDANAEDVLIKHNNVIVGSSTSVAKKSDAIN